MLRAQLHERDAYRALFSFGGTLTSLDPAQVTNIAAAILNARPFASEVVAMLKATQHAIGPAVVPAAAPEEVA